MELDASPKLKLPKIKELKVLDAKSAQNICEYRNLVVSCVGWELCDVQCVCVGVCVHLCIIYTILSPFYILFLLLHASS